MRSAMHWRAVLLFAVLATWVSSNQSARAAPRPTPAQTVLHSFTGGRDGGAPQAGLIADATGALYGTATNGGAHGYGVAFKLVPSGSGYVVDVLYAFHGRDGASPSSGLFADGTGALYGETSKGGKYGMGTVYELVPAGPRYLERVLHSFGAEEGTSASGGVIADASGTLYGTSSYGGAHGAGDVFKLTPSAGRYHWSILYSFGASRHDGQSPFGGVIIDKLGNLFGTTAYGGEYEGPTDSGFGSVFELAPRGSGYGERILHRFDPVNGDANIPFAGLVADASGSLYGSGFVGGNGEAGAVFKLSPSGRAYSESVILSVDSIGGALPSAALTIDRDGNLYGTTYYGGGSNGGLVFKLAPSGSGYAASVLATFPTFGDGANPEGMLLVNGAGTIFGTTPDGGAGQGVIFQVTQ